MLPIDDSVLDAVCRQLCQWETAPLRRSWSIAVNVSAKQFCENGFVACVECPLAKRQGSAHWLGLELTESLLHGNIEKRQLPSQ